VSSLILRTASRFLLILLFQFSIFLLLRGHNEPGGGFVGGLVLATAFTLYAIAYDVRTIRRFLPCRTQTIIGVGLLLGGLSGVWSLFRGQPFMTGQWAHLEFMGLELHLGTPLLFDFGVYLVVVGVVLIIIMSLAEEEE
jgi:multicomponent Na+:H+ antiporter subunit B